MFSYKDLSDFFTRIKAHYIDLMGEFNKADVEGKALYREKILYTPMNTAINLLPCLLLNILDNKMLK